MERQGGNNLAWLYGMEVLSGLSRGSFLVCIGWVTLVVTGEIARVGQVFVLGLGTNLVLGLVLGAVVDRFNRKTLVILAHLGIAAVMTLSGRVIDSAGPWVFYLLTISVFALRLLYQLAHDGLLRANVGERALMPVIARTRVVHLAATAIGTAVAGLVLDRQGIFAGFAFSGLASLLLILTVLPVRGVVALGGAQGLGGFMRDLAQGLPLVLRTPELRAMAAVAALALPLGQLVNAVLSGLVRQDLGWGSDRFALIDAAWPVGGMAAALVLGAGLFKQPGARMVFVFALIAGALTILLPLTGSLAAMMVIHGLMGCAVWLCHIQVDARVLGFASDANAGRVKAAIYLIFSIFAIAMCLSPSVIALPRTTGYFLFWGAVTVIGCALLLLRREPPARGR